MNSNPLQVMIMWWQIISRECYVLYVSLKNDEWKVAISDRHIEKDPDNSITCQYAVPMEFLHISYLFHGIRKFFEIDAFIGKSCFHITRITSCAGLLFLEME